MSVFQTIYQNAFPVLDGAFAETIEVHPMIPGEFSAGTPDPNNPVFTVRGILTNPDEARHPASVIDVHGGRSDILPGDAAIDFDASLFGGGRTPQPGWLMIAMDRAPNITFAVTSPPKFDGLGRVTFELKKIA
jgi:hypothetical protein